MRKSAVAKSVQRHHRRQIRAEGIPARRRIRRQRRRDRRALARIAALGDEVDRMLDRMGERLAALEVFRAVAEAEEESAYFDPDPLEFETGEPQPEVIDLDVERFLWRLGARQLRIC